MDPRATFLKRFGDLVALLRSDPANDAAQDLALTAAGAAIVHGPVRLEPGAATSEPAGTASLQARLLARRVESIYVSSEVDLSELLTLARALAHDTTPLLSNPHIEVATVSTVTRDDQEPPPPSPAGGSAPNRRRGTPDRRMGDDRRRARQPRWPGLERRRGDDRRMAGERRLYLAKELRAETVRLYGGLVRATANAAWDETLYTAVALARLAPLIPQADRRVFMMQARRVLRRSAIDAVIDRAERDPAVRAATVEVLCWVGLEAAEAMLDRLRASPTLGPRGFLLEALGRMPQGYRMMASLLRGTEPHEIRYGAMLVAKLGRVEAAPLLRSHLNHSDESVRAAVLHALAQLHHAPVGDALRASLQHPSPATRIAAAEAIATWRVGALGVLLSVALDEEHDPTVWRAFIDALGRVGSCAACAALAAVALRPRSLLRLRDYTSEQRLMAVAALARAQTAAARATLERLARDAHQEVQEEARRALTRPAEVAAIS